MRRLSLKLHSTLNISYSRLGGGGCANETDELQGNTRKMGRTGREESFEVARVTAQSFTQPTSGD